jgi:hypothetical protein
MGIVFQSGMIKTVQSAKLFLMGDIFCPEAGR